MGHSTKVSAAIQAALDDINLLRPLVDAPDKQAANEILTNYEKNKLKLGLHEADLEEFWKSLKHGVITINATTLADYYTTLLPFLRAEATRGRIEEWTP